MNERNEAVTLDAVRREVEAALAERDRAEAEARVQRRLEVERFDMDLAALGSMGAVAFAGCWFACAMLAVALKNGPAGSGTIAFLCFAPFALWLAGAAFYARRRFGPGRDDGDAP